METVNTVTGPESVENLGFTLMHEHVLVGGPGIFTSFPDLFGPEDRTQRAIDALKQAKSHGIDTMVDATTHDLGKEPEFLRSVSEGSGVNIINTTGWWLSVPGFLRGVSANQMSREFVRDVEEGLQRYGRQSRNPEMRGRLRRGNS